MEFVPIFADPNETPFRGLYAVRYEDAPDGENSWSEFVDRITDPEYRRDFLKARKEKLIDERTKESIELSDASMQVLEEFLEINYTFRTAYRKGIEHLTATFEERFQPLNNDESDGMLLKSKGRGRKNQRWLRIYAVKIAPDLYIVTGGAIKLFKYMADDVATQDEWAKINRLRDRLKQEGMFYQDAYTELEL
ncbi:MAG: hypothetical protein K9J06_12055 [Flavobacteriales bacterium]|nr:hypothetical protein [Flavobacteriales bacterium]